MNKSRALEILHEYMNSHACELGIRSIGLFGSVACDRAGAGSDIDIVVDLDSPKYSHLSRIKTDLEAIFGVSVDVIRKRPGMNRLMQRCIEEDAVYA